VTIVLECLPGDHLVSGDLLGCVWRREGAVQGRAEEDLRNAIRAAVAVGGSRTPHQDVRFSLLQLVEMAVRALSPGTNDPFTAVNAMDDLAASLSVMARRDPPSSVRRGPDGQVRVVLPVVRLADLLAEVFDYLRSYALEAPSVLHRALALGRAVGLRARDPAVRRLIEEEISALVEAYSGAGPCERDLQRFTVRAQEVRAALLAAPVGAGPSRGPRPGDPGAITDEPGGEQRVETG
jgi:uncharacterized membrane protein